MKIYLKILSVICIILTGLVFTSCEIDDLAEPLWEQEYEEPAEPVISSISPADEAMAGVNKITITGQNFGSSTDKNTVYFDDVVAEVTQGSSTSLIVRRPDLVTEACTIKVVSSEALVVAREYPYKIDSVHVQYGSFLESDFELNALVVDNSEVLYVIDGERGITSVEPNGTKTEIAYTSRFATDAVMGPDGRIYIPEENRTIEVLDPSTTTVESWTRLPSGKVVTKGDFDSDDYYYCAGSGTGIVIVAPDENLTATTNSSFENDEVLAMRAYENYLYSAVRTEEPDAQTPEFAVWKNELLGSGTLGSKELVVDLTDAVDTDTTIIITGINFSSDDRMFISNSSDTPLLVYDLLTDELDVFYKEILPSYIQFFNWGSGDYIYIITGDLDEGVDMTVYRVDLGVTTG